MFPPSYNITFVGPDIV